MKFQIIFILLLPAFAFSQEKCADLFSVRSISTANHSVDETNIQNRLEALVLLQFQIEQNIFEKDSQLTQAKENLAKQLQELIKINPKHLTDFRKLADEKNEELKKKSSAEKKKKVEEQKAKAKKLKDYEVFSKEDKFVI